MREINSTESIFVVNLQTIAQMGFGFKIESNRDVVTVRRRDGVKIEFDLSEMVDQNLQRFHNRATKALLTPLPKPELKLSGPKPIRRKKVA